MNEPVPERRCASVRRRIHGSGERGVRRHADIGRVAAIGVTTPYGRDCPPVLYRLSRSAQPPPDGGSATQRTAGPVLSVDAGRSDAMGATSTAASDRVAAADADGVRRPSPTLVRLLGKWGQRGWHSARRHAVALSIVGVLLAIGSLAWVSLRHRQPDIFPAPVANGGDNQGRTPLMVVRLATADGRLVGSAAALTAGGRLLSPGRDCC